MARILIVEDEPINAELAGVICRAAGHLVAFADHGQQALACLAHDSFDLVLLDVKMPVMDGIELTRLLRADKETSALPIIGVTARASAIDHTLLLEAGMNAVLTKPYTNKMLLNALEAILQPRLPSRQLDTSQGRL